MSESLLQKRAALKAYEQIVADLLCDMSRGTKTEFLESPVYKAFFKDFVRSHIEYLEAEREEVLLR